MVQADTLEKMKVSFSEILGQAACSVKDLDKAEVR